jgi:putative DNA methylase
MQQPKKLIEVAMPIKEISAESVRDGRVQHGHISSLHKWWARRPLPVCRAVIFASLIPDPLDDNCPMVFRETVKELLGKPLALGKGESTSDWYKPYTDIPYTAAHDMMDDNLRNRLLIFIGKFSEKFVENDRIGKTTQSKDQLSDASLIKWESRHNDAIIAIARKLIWVANNSTGDGGASTRDLLNDFDVHYNAIKEAERSLYSLIDRHLNTRESEKLSSNLNRAIKAFLDKMPKVFDPFAGGGAIPLEAARLGCQSYGNDINPVAHIIQKGSLEFPQKYGKPITYSKEQFEKIYGEEAFKNLPGELKKIDAGETKGIRIPNRLSFDVEFYTGKLLKLTDDTIGHFYPKDENGKRPIAYYWARVGICSNPSCKAEVPLLKQFYLCRTENKKIHLKPIIEDRKILFEIIGGEYDAEGWIDRGNLKCPCCGNITENKLLKAQFVNKQSKEIILAVILDGPKGKYYRLPNSEDTAILNEIKAPSEYPNEKLPVEYTKGMAFCLWGYSKWGDIFSKRQIVALYTLVEKLGELKGQIKHFDEDYSNAIITYLAIIINKIASRQTTFGLIDVGRETIVDPFSKQAIQMVFDYPEITPFASDQSYWITKFIESESQTEFTTICNNAASGEKSQFPEKYISAVVTDPPYYDAIAYADISDFFYVWLKRTISDIYPLNFSTPQTPKGDECTALKHHHDGKVVKANLHFENKLLQIFDAIEHQTADIVSIMFAHQSTQAWTTLCNSILGSRMNITGSWANDTEMIAALKTDKAFLSSSVTVACRPVKREGFASFRDVKKAIEDRVKIEVEQLYKLGFRGADLLTACFGKAVSEFGKYETVEKADGSEVLVSDLLEIARDSAFNALLKGFDADEYTKFYIAWAQLYGFTESDFDDVNRLVKIGLSIETNTLFQEKLLIKNLNKQSLAGYSQRVAERPNLGTEPSDPIIDLVHRAMLHFKKNDRTALLQHIARVANSPENLFWRVINSLVEILPLDKEHDDKKISTELLASKDNLLRDSKQVHTTTSQTTLGL